MYILPVSYQYSTGNYTQMRSTPYHLQNSCMRDTVSFGSSTAAGKILKKMNLPSAYTGVYPLDSSIINRAFKRLETATNISETVKILGDYKENLETIELAMFHHFEKFAEKFPDLQLLDCINSLHSDAHDKLKLEEFKILDEIDQISDKMSPKTALEVRKQTTHCREIIIANKEGEKFKRKDLLDSLNKIVPEENEKEAYEEMQDAAWFLPSSGTSENAFIVKYATRSNEEIARRIIKASEKTIDHIDAASEGGEDSLSNFALCTTIINSIKGSLSLKKMIKRFPDIPKHAQKYIDVMIMHINHGALQGNEAYPYQIKRKFAHSSQKEIDLDLSAYKYSYKEAYDAEKRYHIMQQRRKRRA